MEYWLSHTRRLILASQNDQIESVCVDEELGREGFTYFLKSGLEGTVHMDSFLSTTKTRSTCGIFCCSNLTLEAKQRLQSSVFQNEVLRRSKTSASQLSRLLDVSNKTEVTR